jgi:septal ring factor EnvC (AmiA/AmiB activator)
MSISASSSPSSAPLSTPEQLADLRDMLARQEKTLSERKAALDQWQQAESSLQTETDRQFKTLNNLAKEDGRLRKIRKITPFVGMGSFPLIGGAVAAGFPAVALVAAALTLGSVLMHEYSLRRDRKIDRQFNPLKEEYARNAAHLNSVQANRAKLALEVKALEDETARMRKLRDQSEADLRAMARVTQPGQAPSGMVDIEEGRIVVDGVTLRKKAARKAS